MFIERWYDKYLGVNLSYPVILSIKERNLSYLSWIIWKVGTRKKGIVYSLIWGGICGEGYIRGHDPPIVHLLGH